MQGPAIDPQPLPIDLHGENYQESTTANSRLSAKARLCALGLGPCDLEITDDESSKSWNVLV